MTVKFFDKMSKKMQDAYKGPSTEWPTAMQFKKMRNKEIVRLVDKQHVTMTAIANWFGISKQRVQQIYSREKEDDV